MSEQDDRDEQELNAIDKLIGELDGAQEEIARLREQMAVLIDRMAILRGASRNRVSMWHYWKRRN